MFSRLNFCNVLVVLSFWLGTAHGVTLRVPDTFSAPGRTVTVPVSVDDAAGIAGAEFTLLYDPNILTFVEVKLTPLTEGFHLKYVNKPGKVAVALARSEGISGGSGDLVEVTFTVASDASGTSPFVLEKVALFDEDTQKIPCLVENGAFAVIPPPLIVSIVPDSAFNIGPISVTIRGNNFQPGASVKLIGLGADILGMNVVIIDSTRITCTFDLSEAEPGARDLVVTNPDAQADTSTGAFRVVELDIVPPAAIKDLAVSDVRTTSITLSWTAPGDDGNEGTASWYDVRYSTSVITEANWNSATKVEDVPRPKAAGSSESFTVAGLQPNTLYYFAIKTADEVPNWSKLSNIAYGRTSPLPEPDIELSEAHHDYGDVRTNTTTDWVLRITNSGNADLRVIKVVSDEPTVFWVESPTFPRTVAPSESIKVTICFKPPYVGEFSGELTVTSDDPDEGSLKVSLSGRGISVRKPMIVYNYPNPARGNWTTFRWYLDRPAEVSIRIFDLSGDLVDELNIATKPGYNEVRWDLSDISPGVYNYIFKAECGDGEVVGPVTKRMLVVR